MYYDITKKETERFLRNMEEKEKKLKDMSNLIENFINLIERGKNGFKQV